MKDNPLKVCGINPFLNPCPVETFENIEAGLFLLQDIEILRSIAGNQPGAEFSDRGHYGYHLLVDSMRFALTKQKEVLVEESRKGEATIAKQE